MIFAFATDEKMLTVFSSEEEAIANCEGFDVAQGGWLFFAVDGTPLAPAFSVPASRAGLVVSHGKYSLRSASVGSLHSLARILSSVVGVEGLPPLNTVAEIEKLLTLHDGTQQSAPISRILK